MCLYYWQLSEKISYMNYRIKNKFDLTGKVAIVTGSSKGIGEAIVWGLAEFGAKVVVSSRDQDSIDQVATQLNQSGYEAIAVACHVAREEDCKNLVKVVMEKFGRIDILVNNAGTNPYYGPLSKMPMDLYQKTMDINLVSAIQLSNEVLGPMREQGGGSIINVSSIEGYHASKYMAAYNISKAGLLMLTKNQAVEWAKYGVRVNAICPGYVKTKMTASLSQDEEYTNKFISNILLGRMADPDEMAGLAVFLASDASSYCTGTSVLNDGGLSHIQYH